MEFALFTIIPIALLIGAILGIVSYLKISDLQTRLHKVERKLKKMAGIISVIGLYMFVTLEIRHLWHGGIQPDLTVVEGELYTYSSVWLLMSVATIIYGAYKNNKDAQKAGIIALLIVIAKDFFWDMRDLDGLWRVVSFLGLGLALLGIAYLFNKIKAVEEKLII